MAKSSFFKDGGAGTNTAASIQNQVDAAAASATSAATSLASIGTELTDATAAKVAAEAAQAAAEAAQTSSEGARDTAITNRNAADTSAASASTSATNSQTSETNSASSQSAAATSAANAATSETNSAASAVTASTQAGLATTNGAAQVTLATAQVALATTQAGNSATSATSSQTAQAASETARDASVVAKTASETARDASVVAQTASETAKTASEDARDLALGYRNTAETHKDAAAVSAATASTQAGLATTNGAAQVTLATAQVALATTQAGISTTKASEAASSATAAAASQTAAASSAASAASTYDQFGDRYHGSLSSNPSTDPDGNALAAGMLYFNSTAGEMRVYDGSSWIAASAATNASLILYEYTATAGQTTFSGSDDNSATLSYTADNLQVVMNGVVLDPSDFTATNGTSVVLASAAALNDLVNIYAFKSFTTADMVSKTAGGTFSGAVGFSGGITGDVSFDTDTLKVDSSNNRVGVGIAPDTALHVKGSGVPVEVNSSNSNSFKQEFSDNGTTRGFIGANSTNAFMVGDTSGNTLFRVASNGLIGIPNLPAFQATGSGLMAFSGSAALADVVLGSAYVNNGSDYDTTTGKFTCPVSGIYLFFASVTTTDAATGVEAFIINETASSSIARVISYGDSYDQAVMIGIDDCVANQVIKVQAINNNNTSFSLDRSRCNFGGVLLGAT